MLRKLDLADMDAAARVHRAAFDHALPWLAGLHTPAEDRWFFRERVFPACAVWGMFEDTAMLGLIAFRDDWIDQLYVLPHAQGRGIGTEFLKVAQKILRSPAALDVPAQSAGPLLLRGEGLHSGRRNRWRTQRGTGA
jgi:GNAT superfamily N-acetyltransferase